MRSPRTSRVLVPQTPSDCCHPPVCRFFRRLDRDGSGALDVAELQRGLVALGLVLAPAEAEAVCRNWDRDGSGTLDLEEFLRALRVWLSLEGVRGPRSVRRNPSLR